MLMSEVKSCPLVIHCVFNYVTNLDIFVHYKLTAQHTDCLL